jgi:hypothetical protein
MKEIVVLSYQDNGIKVNREAHPFHAARQTLTYLGLHFPPLL